MSDVVFQPTSMKPVSEHPLDKGVVLNMPSQDIPDGGFLSIADFIAGPEGLLVRPGSEVVGTNPLFPYIPSDLVSIWRNDLTQKLMVLTRYSLFAWDINVGLTEVAWTYTVGTITISGTSVTGSGTLWVNTPMPLMAGDIIRAGGKEGVVDTVLGDTSLLLKSATLTNGAGVAYVAQRSFYGINPQVMFDVVGYFMMMADGKHPLMRYDAVLNTLAYWTVDPLKKIYPTTVKYSTGTVAVDGATGIVTGTATSWLNIGIQVGALMSVTVSGVTTSDTIASVDSATQIHLTTPGKVPTCTAGKVFTIQQGVDFACKCCASFGNRTWVGGTTDAVDGVRRTRIRWSALADTADFSIATNYYDLPYTTTEMQALVPLGDVLIAYFEDAIFMGVPTNYPTLPLAWQRVETGGMGLVGAKAITSWLGAHFFVGPDDIYQLTSNGISKIGSPVVSQTVGTCKKPAFVRVCVDPQRYRILFGFPINNENIENVWSYEYRAKCWSRDAISTYMMSNVYVSSALSWDGLAPLVHWDSISAKYATWNAMNIGSVARSVYYEHSMRVWRVENAVVNDWAVAPFYPSFITKDHDFGMDDASKVVVGFSLKLSYGGSVLPPTSLPLNMLIEVSTNRGGSWKSCGILVVGAGRDEGWVTFRATGSTFRFRGSVLQMPSSNRFTITSIGMKVRLGGTEMNSAASR